MTLLLGRRVPLSLLVFIALSFTQCKTDPDSATSDRQDFIVEYCKHLTPCCEGAGTPSGCEQKMASSLPTAFDPARGRACLDAITANEAKPSFCSAGVVLADTPACKVLTTTSGTVPIGGACNDAVSGVECASSTEGSVACVFGKGKQICQLVSLGEEGASCVENSNADGSLPTGISLDVEVKEKGVYCNRSKDLHCKAGTCAKNNAIDAECTNDESCAASAYCEFATPRRCKARGEDGASCVGAASCVSKNCDNATKKCSSTLPPSVKSLLCR